MDDLDALLADLQNTVSPETSLIGGSSTPGYGSLNGTRSHGTTSAASSYRPYENRSTTPLQSQSPTYQNREAIEEAATARSAGGGGGVVSSHPAGVGGGGGGGGGNVVGHHQYNQSGAGSKMPSLNNNLSELDTLLQDLSNARYNSHAPERVPDYRSTNGGGKNSPMARSTSSLSAGTRPATVDSLLEELGGGISNGDYSQDDQQRQQQQPPRVKVTIEETDYQPEYNYSQSHSVPGSLNRRDHHQVHHVPIGFDPIVTSNGHTASNATKELDDLMASLSDFKINGSSGGNQHHHQQQQQHQQQPDSAYAKPNKAAATAPVKTSSSSSPSSASAVTAASSALPPAGAGSLYPSDSYDRRIHISETTRTTTHYPSAARYPAETNGLPSHQHQQSYVAKCHVTATRHQNQLDSMLGNLQADMSRQGVNTTQKGCCSACDKPIVGQVITALGKTWHPEHFTCTHCNQELGTRNFFEREGHPYCEPDYHNLFSPRCAYCNGPILDKCVTALDKTWHTEHFFCAQCGKQFGEDGFHERDGKPYCRDDYFEMFAPKCGGCNRAIMENYISALNAQWHPDCFVCRDCRQKFQGGSFFDHEGQPYCETHYHAKRGSLCAGCHKPITGRCITAMFRKFHPEHFVCAFCLKQLNKGTFKEQNDKPYCHGCFEKLFG